MRQVVDRPGEFELVGFHDPDPEVVAARRQSWGPKIPGFRVFDRPEDLLPAVEGVVVEGRFFRDGRPRDRPDGRLARPARFGHAVSAHHHAEPGTFVDNGLAVFSFPHAWGLIEVPALEVAPCSRRIEVYGTRAACVIPHLGSGHLANPNVQSIEIYREGEPDCAASTCRPARSRSPT